MGFANEAVEEWNDVCSCSRPRGPPHRSWAGRPLRRVNPGCGNHSDQPGRSAPVNPGEVPPRQPGRSVHEPHRTWAKCPEALCLDFFFFFLVYCTPPDIVGLGSWGGPKYCYIITKSLGYVRCVCGRRPEPSLSFSPLPFHLAALLSIFFLSTVSLTPPPSLFFHFGDSTSSCS